MTDAQKAKEAKDLGNTAFQESRYEEAITHFSVAIEFDQSNHLLYSNRAAAYASLKNWELSLKDADKTVDLNPDFIKGYSRKGTAHFFLDQLEEAANAYISGLEKDLSANILSEGLLNVNEKIDEIQMKLVKAIQAATEDDDASTATTSTATSTPTQFKGGAWVTMITPFTTNNKIDWIGVDRLVDWYISKGLSGIFTVCQSGEMFSLTPEERLALAIRVVKRVAGRINVVAAGNFGATVDEQTKFIKQMYSTGVQAVVVIVSLVAKQSESDETWKTNCSRIMELTGKIPLGLYECPQPYHRLLSADLVEWATSTSRFVFMKDTSCSTKAISDKIAKIKSKQSSDAKDLTNTKNTLYYYNANVATLTYSLQAGAVGFCGIAANFHPDLLVWVCNNAVRGNNVQQAFLIQKYLTVAEMTVAHKYPQSSKVYLKLFEKGFKFLQAQCRSSSHDFNEEEVLRLQSLQELAQFTKEELKKEKTHAKSVLL